MRVLMIGNKLTLVSGHSRPAWQTARYLQGAGHSVRMIVSTMDAKTDRRHRSLVQEEGYQSLWDERLEFGRGKLTPGNSELRRRLEAELKQCDLAHFYDMRALRAVSAMFGGQIPAKTVLQIYSLSKLRFSDLRRAGWPAVVRTLTRIPDLTSALVPTALVRRLIGLADTLVCTSKFLADTLAGDYRVDSARLKVVYSGVELQDPDLEPLANRPDFLYYGWPGSHRGTLDSAAAMGAFLKRGHKANCIVSTYRMSRFFGEDVLVLRALSSIFARQGVQWFDFMPDIRRRLIGTRAAVLPFRSPFGYVQPAAVVLESMAAGVPVISTDIGGVSEVVSHNHNGLLVKPKRISAMADAMEKLWLDDDLYARMSQAARQTIAERFTLDAMFQEMVRIYEGLHD